MATKRPADPDPIVDIDTFICDTGLARNHVYVRVETALGRVGLGEASQNDLDRGVAAAVELLRAQLVGRAATETIAFLGTKISNDRLGRTWLAAISAVEQATWDLLGQISGLPVYQLLGGSVRDTIPCYATIWAGQTDHTPEALAEEAARCVRQGLDGVKIVPFVDRASHTARNWLTAGVDRVRAVREAIGPDAMLMIECAFGLNSAELSRVDAQLAEFECAWLEAPLPWDDAALLQRHAAHLGTPLASGELAFGRRRYRELIERQSVAILQPDVKWTGGIAEAKKVAAWAETYQIQIALHNNSGIIGTMASAHLAATLPNLFVLEVPARWPGWLREVFPTSPWWGDGPLNVDRLRGTSGLGPSFAEPAARALSQATSR